MWAWAMASADRAEPRRDTKSSTRRSAASVYRAGLRRLRPRSLPAVDMATDMTVTGLAAGAPIGAESSLNKVWWSEMDVHLHDTALRLLGPDADLEGAWMKGYQFALAGPIYAGTNEIQRNVIAERLLGLPRR